MIFSILILLLLAAFGLTISYACALAWAARDATLSRSISGQSLPGRIGFRTGAQTDAGSPPHFIPRPLFPSRPESRDTIKKSFALKTSLLAGRSILT